MAGRAELSVPPGFRFHPTEEELLCYYLKKKVSYEPIDLGVIREVDLNKLEPWDLKEKCGIGSGHQNDWYFFSHKDKKYPTGTRTNRATAAGFWKATGRDKAIYHSNSKRIGMRKTLVFYTGRAPRGHKTDWIMHEYRLDDDHHNTHQEFQEDGWVVCRVFTKKNQARSFQEQPFVPVKDNSIADGGCKHYNSDEAHYNKLRLFDHNMTTSIHLPRLHSPESTVPVPFSSSHQLPSTPGGGGTASPEKHVFAGDWSFLDRLLAANQNMDHNNNTKSHLQYFPPAVAEMLPPSLTFPFSTNFHG